MLVAYNKMPILIPVDITKDVVKLVAQKLFGEFRKRQHGLVGSTGMEIKIWRGQQKTSY